jgi:hypothetical protein
MKKLLFLLIFSSSLLFGELYKISDFETDIFSKDGNRLKKIELSIMFEGDGIRQYDYKLLDALNVVISSFYIEDLFTSKGKERFKDLLQQYVLKKYMIDVDFIYILRFGIKEQVDIDTLLKRIEKMESEIVPRKKSNFSTEERKQNLTQTAE